jgi:hypothetical protein
MHEEAVRTVRTGNHAAEADESLVVDGLDVDLDARGQLFLPGCALSPRDESVRRPQALLISYPRDLGQSRRRWLLNMTQTAFLGCPGSPREWVWACDR